MTTVADVPADGLSDTQRQIVELAREFAREHIEPRAAEWDRTKHFPRDVIAELGGKGVLTPASWGMFSLRLPPFTPPRAEREDRKVLLEALAGLGEHAAREGVWLALEPINRYEDYMINRLDQAVGLAEEVERDLGWTRSGCADLFHMNIEEDDLAESITDTGRRLAHVHVDDSNRLQPGTGHLDFAAALGALRTVGYDDWLALECRLRGDPEEALPATSRFLAPYL